MKISSAFHRGALAGLALTLGVGLASASTIIVDPGGSGDYATIQGALDHASDGDTILVAAGTYVEDLIVPVSVTIAGAGVGQSVVLPATSNPGVGSGSQVTTTTWMVRIQASGVILGGFTFDGDNPALPRPIDARGGIITDYSAGSFDDVEVIGCEVKNLIFRGIYMAAYGTGHRLAANRVSNVKGLHLDSAAIFFYGAVGEATGNVVEDCSIGLGFLAGGGGELSGNSISECDLGVYASQCSAPLVVGDNSITDSTQGIQAIRIDTTVDLAGNTIVRCPTGLSLVGNGTGSIHVDGNTIDGEGEVGTTGMLATTDAGSFGVGDLAVVARNNRFVGQEYAIVLNEDLFDPSPILSCTLSGDAASYNTFSGSLSYNLYLELCDDDVDARHNAWGAVTPALIEQTIHHEVDVPGLGLVDFSDPVALEVTVDDDGPADYATINPAVQDLLPGGTIRVAPGLYVEDVLIDRSCLIQGAGTSADPQVGTVLRGATSSSDLSVVEVVGPDVFIENLRVDGQQPVYEHARRAIYAHGTSGLTVTGCVVHTARTAIAYDQSTDGTFLDNDVYDFGVSLNEGGGIFLWNSTGVVGLPGKGNWVHDGPATAVIFHNSSAGSAYDNLAENSGLGYLSNGAIAPTRFEGNRALDNDQGFQGIGNHAPVTYVDNEASGGQWGFILFGLGGELHTYDGNWAHHTNKAWVFTTECVYGDDDAVAVFENNRATDSNFGVFLEETASSKSYLMNVSLDGTNGSNWIQGNTYQDIYLLKCNDDIDARGNYLGAADPAVVEGQVKHQVDDPTLGLVDFSVLAPSFVYCEAKVASAGCIPRIGSEGVCSATSPSSFNVTAVDVVSLKFGFLFYGYERNELPFWGGTLCLKGPLRRTQVQHSGGGSGEDCTGSFSYDMNALIQGGSPPGLDPGVSIFAQYWYRDPLLEGDYPAGLTDAITFTIAP